MTDNYSLINVMDTVHKATAPERMNVREAIDFIKDLRTELEMYLEAMECDL